MQFHPRRRAPDRNAHNAGDGGGAGLLLLFATGERCYSR
jgi:hypothetical protein